MTKKPRFCVCIFICIHAGCHILGRTPEFSSRCTHASMECTQSSVSVAGRCHWKVSFWNFCFPHCFTSSVAWRGTQRLLLPLDFFDHNSIVTGQQRVNDESKPQRFKSHRLSYRGNRPAAFIGPPLGRRSQPVGSPTRPSVTQLCAGWTVRIPWDQNLWVRLLQRMVPITSRPCCCCGEEFLYDSLMACHICNFQIHLFGNFMFMQCFPSINLKYNT